MAESDLYRKGIALRSELMGEAFVSSMNSTTYSDPIMQKFRDVAAETVFGALWTRPGLDLKTRALVCVVSDVATGRDPNWPCTFAWRCARVGQRMSWWRCSFICPATSACRWCANRC